MIIDVHAHMHSTDNPQAILKAVHQYGIQRVYVSNVSERGYYPTDTGVDYCNRAAADFCKEHSDIFRYMCFVNPYNKNTQDVIRRAVEDDHAKGIKLLVATKCDSHLVNPVAEMAIRYDMPILIHAFHKYDGGLLTNESTAYEVAELAKRYPEAKLIMAHLGGDAYHGLKAVRDCKNVWADISGTIYRNGELEYAVKLLGEDRILFGTDAQGVPYPLCIGKVQEADISEEAKEKIFWKNTWNLFGGDEG